MSEASNSNNQAVTPDQIQNLKGEFSQKLQTQETALADLKKQNDTLLAKIGELSRSKKQADPVEEEDFETISYKNPLKAKQIIKEEAKRELREEMQIANAQTARVSSVMQQAVIDFPEMQDSNSALYKKAVENYNKMPKDEQSNPIAYRTAIVDAAMDLDIKPKSKRANDDGDFAGPTSGASMNSERRTKQKEDPLTKEWARILEEQTGVDLTSDEATKRIQERQKRDWGRYRQPMPIKQKKGK